jgi:CopG family transcriptional regulator/antitoxin EndoAI
MAQTKRIMISIPQQLLEEVDAFLCNEDCNRSEFIRRAMIEFIRERKRVRIREQMRAGYASMAAINRQLCEEGLIEDAASLSRYERLLVESDKSG